MFYLAFQKRLFFFSGFRSSNVQRGGTEDEPHDGGESTLLFIVLLLCGVFPLKTYLVCMFVYSCCFQYIYLCSAKMILRFLAVSLSLFLPLPIVSRFFCAVTVNVSLFITLFFSQLSYTALLYVLLPLITDTKSTTLFFFSEVIGKPSGASMNLSMRFSSFSPSYSFRCCLV